MTSTEKLACSMLIVKKADAYDLAAILAGAALHNDDHLSEEEKKYQQEFRKHVQDRARTGALIGGGLGMGASALLLNNMQNKPLIEKIIGSLILTGGGAGLGFTTGMFSTMFGNSNKS